MSKKQYEDNATNVLIMILRGENNAKAGFIFDFLLSKWRKKHKPSFSGIIDISTRKNLKDTKLDITMKFKNSPDYTIEIKDNNSRLTTKELSEKKRDAFLIPYNYPFKLDRHSKKSLCVAAEG